MDGQTDEETNMMRLIVAFRNFAKVPENDIRDKITLDFTLLYISHSSTSGSVIFFSYINNISLV